MKKLILGAVSLLFLSALPLSAISSLSKIPRGAQELIPSRHWVYDALEAISLEARILNFADSAPVSVQHIRDMLAEIDYDSLSEQGRTQYDRIESYFEEAYIGIQSDLLSVGMDVTFNPECFYKSNDDIDWTFDRYSRSGLIEAPVTIGVGDYVTMSATMALEQNKGVTLHDDNYTNIPTSASQIDTNFPHTAYINAGKKLTEKTGVQFMMHLGEQSIGRTQSGSVIWSDYLTGATTGKLTFYAPALQYSAAVTELNVDKYFYYHQLDVRLFKRFSITLLEGLLVYDSLELRYLNPWTIFHGFAAWRDYGDYDGSMDYDSDDETHTCDYFAVKMEFVPFSGMRLYGLFAMTQYQTPYERSNWPNDVTPDGLGFQGGGEWYIPFASGYLHFGLEGTYTQPYLYIKASPNWSLVRTYSENIGDHAIFYEWIGSPFGPDTIAGELTAGYETPGKLSVDLTYLFMARGEQSGTSVFDSINWGGQVTQFTSDDADSWCYPTDANGQSQYKSTPSGTPEYVNRLSVRLTWQAKPYLQIIAQPAYVLKFNTDHVVGETAHGFEIALAFELSPLRLLK